MKKVICLLIFVFIAAFSLFAQDFGNSNWEDSADKVKATRSGIFWSADSDKINPENVILTTETIDFRVTYFFVNDKLLKEQHDFIHPKDATALHILSRFVKTTEYLVQRYGELTFTHISDDTAIWYWFAENTTITLMYTDKRNRELPDFSILLEYSKK